MLLAAAVSNISMTVSKISVRCHFRGRWTVFLAVVLFHISGECAKDIGAVPVTPVR